jgi:hypothetical protein
MDGTGFAIFIRRMALRVILAVCDDRLEAPPIVKKLQHCAAAKQQIFPKLRRRSKKSGKLLHEST